MHKCPFINVETEPRMGDLESWINANFGKLNLNLIININHITNPPQFFSVNGNIKVSNN